MSRSAPPLPHPSLSQAWPLAWEEPSCLLCGSRRRSPVVEAPDHLAGGGGPRFIIVQCAECGLCFTSPRPSSALIGSFYPAGYHSHRTSRTRLLRGWWRSFPFTWRGARGKRRPMPGASAGRLLDFGCGGGAFLGEMHRLGWQVLGIDTSEVAVSGARYASGLPVLAGTLPHPELGDARFDVITMWNSLEHVHAPLEVLREAHRLLEPGGELVVEVPNLDSLAFRWFGPSWYGLDLPRHLTHFTPRSLSQMLQRAGFQPGPARMLRRSAWMRWSARIAARSPESRAWLSWLGNGPLSRVATGYSCLVAQSDCMVIMARR